jgi:molybdenum cofactor cytidylyltransferase
MPSLAIVPAAGRSARFGSPKLLADINGEPLLNWTLWSLLDAGIRRVTVVTSPDADFARVKLIHDPRVTITFNPDPDRGMLSSIQEGLAATTGDPIVVLPADMPFVRSGTVADIVQTCLQRQRVVVPVHGGRRGHPVAMPGTLRRAILEADPVLSLKDALGAALEAADEFPVEDDGILRDVDRPEDVT